MPMRQYNSIQAARDDGQIGRYGLQGDGIHIIYETQIEYGWPNKDSEKDIIWSDYKLQPMPGCCGLVVSFNANVREEFHGYSFGDYFHKERL